MTFKGPGGHSYGAFGLANPVGALGRAVAKLSEVQVPAQPRTTFNVGRIGGGTSVNSIPFEAWMEVDMRSSSASALAALDQRFQAAVDEAVAEENRRWSRPGIDYGRHGARRRSACRRDAVVVADRADRACGRPDAGTPAGAHRRLDAMRTCRSASRFRPSRSAAADPAANGHALSESFDATDAWKGAQNAVLLAIALSQD